MIVGVSVVQGGAVGDVPASTISTLGGDTARISGRGPLVPRHTVTRTTLLQLLINLIK